MSIPSQSDCIVNFKTIFPRVCFFHNVCLLFKGLEWMLYSCLSTNVVDIFLAELFFAMGGLGIKPTTLTRAGLFLLSIKMSGRGIKRRPASPDRCAPTSSSSYPSKTDEAAQLNTDRLRKNLLAKRESQLRQRLLEVCFLW